MLGKNLIVGGIAVLQFSLSRSTHARPYSQVSPYGGQGRVEKLFEFVANNGDFGPRGD